jgi:hypothetical protein
MRRYWGTVTGVAVGMFGGAFGALFGAFIGFLIDLVAVDLRVHHATIRYLDGDHPPVWFPRAIALAGALSAHLRPRSGVDSVTGEALATRLTPFYPDRLARRPVERIIAAAGDHEWIGGDRFVGLLREACTVEQREQVVAAVWEAVRVGGGAESAREEMRELARRAGIDEGFIARELVTAWFRDAGACAVLGVARDAGRDEIRAAYRRLAAQFHPDTAASLSDEQRDATEQAFKRIQAAYERLQGE